MCISATVSYGAAAVLLTTGIYSLKFAKKLSISARLWAVIPVFFGIQQIFEGGVWQALNANNESAAIPLALGFHFFSHFLWPLWIPLSSFLAEPAQSSQFGRLRKIFFGLCAITGALAGSLVYGAMLLHPEWLSISIREHSIVYNLSIPYQSDIHLPITPLMLYGLIILGPLLLSSHKHIRIFGILVLLSMALATSANNAAFVSVWCFFAALLSLYIAFMLRQPAYASKYAR